MTNQEMSNYHKPVLLQETLEALMVKSGAWYVDATLGGGGHTAAILAKGGNVLGLDQDQDAIDETTQVLRPKFNTKRLQIVKSNFVELKQVVDKFGIQPQGNPGECKKSEFEKDLFYREETQYQ